MKKIVLLVLAVAALSFAGCKEKPKETAPQGAMPADATHGGGNPHAGLKPVEIPAGAGHKGKVVTVLNTEANTYVEVEEKGQKIWVASPLVEVKVGDTVEFPESQPMLNFPSKGLKRTFDKIVFVPGLRVTKK